MAISFRMYADVKMNRPVDRNKDYISPGGYEMIMNGKTIKFDFLEYVISIDEKDQSIIHIEHRKPDSEEFEDLDKVVVDDLYNVTSITDFFIYTGEPGESDLKPIELLDVHFVLLYEFSKQISIPDSVLKAAHLGCN